MKKTISAILLVFVLALAAGCSSFKRSGGGNSGGHSGHSSGHGGHH